MMSKRSVQQNVNDINIVYHLKITITLLFVDCQNGDTTITGKNY